MANSIELPCPDDCPLKGMTHQHLQKVEGQPKKHKRKHRRYEDEAEQNRLVNRKRSRYNKNH